MAFATKPKPPVTYKKRAGKHRKHTDQYLRHYWPYLPLLAIVSLGLLCNMFWPTASAVLGARADLTSSSLLSETNTERLQQRESALVMNTQLNQAAEAKALDMVAGNYWSHTSPDGASPWTFIEKTGYGYSKAGENLAYGFANADDVLNAWMQSPEHRQNILDKGYTQVGFGIAHSDNYVGKGAQTIIVAMYAAPVTGMQNVFLPTASSDSNAVLGSHATSRPIARVALLGSSQSASSSLILLTVTGAAALLFILRHGRLLHKSLIRGEVFIAEHLYLDVFIVCVMTAGFILTRTAGFIL